MVDYVLERYLANEPLTLSDKSIYFWVHLANRKGWQRKVDKGMTEGDLRCKSIHLPDIVDPIIDYYVRDLCADQPQHMFACRQPL